MLTELIGDDYYLILKMYEYVIVSACVTYEFVDIHAHILHLKSNITKNWFSKSHRKPLK